VNTLGAHMTRISCGLKEDAQSISLPSDSVQIRAAKRISGL